METHVKVASFSSSTTHDAICDVIELESEAKVAPFSSSANGDADQSDLELENNSETSPFSSPATPSAIFKVGETELSKKLPPCTSLSMNTKTDGIGVEKQRNEEVAKVLEGQSGLVVVVVDVGSSDAEKKKEVESVCRICYLGADLGAFRGSELIQLGCYCKGELGCVHGHCAEAWFRVKGNRVCEICGGIASNINGEGYISLMGAWHEMRMLRNNQNSIEQRNCWSGQPYCNFLMACLVIAFIIPWFFHINIF